MNSRIFQGLKTVAKITGLVFIAFFVLGFVIGIFYGKEIKREMIAQLNKNLAATIDVKDFDFSVLRNFPYASIDMQNVMIREVTGSNNPDTLLYADNLSLLFNVLGVFSKDIAVKKIHIRDARVFIRVDEHGKNNYHFWKSSGDSTSSVIDLEKIILNNVRISYSNGHDRQDYLFTAKESIFSGRFSKDQFTLETTGDLFVEHFRVHDVNYLDHKPAIIKSALFVDTKTGNYRFDKSSVRVAGLHFGLEGDLTVSDPNVKLNLMVSAQEADLDDFISLLPAAYVRYFKDFSCKGRFIFNAGIRGESGEKKIPGVEISFAIRNGKVQPHGSELSIEDLNLSGTFRNKNAGGVSELVIPSLSAMLGGRKLKADFRLDDLSNPFLTLHATANPDLAQLRHFIRNDTLSSLAGDMSLDVSFAGKIKDLPQVNSENLYRVKSSGTIRISNLSLTLKHNPLEFKNFNGSFALSDNDILVNSLGGNISSSDIRLKGVFRNFINFLFIPNQPANIEAQLESREINLDEILANKSTTTESDTSYIMKFNPRLVSDLDVSIGNLIFRKFRAGQMQGKIRIEKQIIAGHGLTFKAMDGRVNMDATINAARRDSVLMNCDAKISGINITMLFDEMENFGQTTMTEQNVRGIITAEIQFNSSWSKDLVINPATARAICDISVENGELNNFRPILALSKYLKLADLNHIRFSNLRNVISISDRKINIPSMEIKSSALNLTANGTHDFDNMVDYHLRLLLSDVLGKKVKENKSEFGEIEDDGLGRTQLMITMKGPVDNPKFGYDRKATKEKIQADISKEKQNLKGILKEEFGLFKKDTTKVEKKNKKEELQVDWEK